MHNFATGKLQRNVGGARRDGAHAMATTLDDERRLGLLRGCATIITTTNTTTANTTTTTT